MLKNMKVYCDIEYFQPPNIISGESLRPDITVVKTNTMFILELTIGLETNIGKKQTSENRQIQGSRENSYRTLSVEVRFVNVSMGAIGIKGGSTCSLIEMLRALIFSLETFSYLIKKLSV